MSYAQPMQAFFRGAAPAVPRRSTSPEKRAERGRSAYATGRQAEDIAARYYTESGYELLEQRWRGQFGEIDLILKKGDRFVFVEVKKSATHGRAAERISRRQSQRICYSALDYCGRSGRGVSTSMRIDAALVDAAGSLSVIENAIWMD